MTTDDSHIDYEQDTEIDEGALDVEWLIQPKLALRYARHAAELQDEVRRLEEKKKIVRSELIMEANENPQKCCNKDRPNQGDIEAYYRSHPDYKEVIEKLNDAKYKAEYAEAAKNEICFTRKKALENLVTLHGQQYFAGPQAPRNITKEFEKQQKQKRSNSNIQISRKK